LVAISEPRDKEKDGSVPSYLAALAGDWEEERSEQCVN